MDFEIGLVELALLLAGKTVVIKREGYIDFRVALDPDIGIDQIDQVIRSIHKAQYTSHPKPGLRSDKCPQCHMQMEKTHHGFRCQQCMVEYYP